MKLNEQTTARDTDALRRRLLDVKEMLLGLNYTTIYQYEYGELDESGINHLRNVWNLKATDEDVLERFEKMAKTYNKHNK